MATETIGSDRKMGGLIHSLEEDGKISGNLFSSVFCEALILGIAARERHLNDPFFQKQVREKVEGDAAAKIQRAQFLGKEVQPEDPSVRAQEVHATTRGFLVGRLSILKLQIYQEFDNIREGRIELGATPASQLFRLSQIPSEDGLFVGAIDRAFVAVSSNDPGCRDNINLLLHVYREGNFKAIREQTIKTLTLIR